MGRLVGMSVKHFLDYWLMWMGETTLDSALPRQVGLSWLNKGS